MTGTNEAVAVRPVVRPQLRSAQPRRLVSVRANRERGLAVYACRVIDLAALVAVTESAIQRSSPLPAPATPAADVLPVLVGALLLAQALRMLGAYHFKTIRGLGRHLAHVAFAVTVSSSVTLLTDAVMAPTGEATRGTELLRQWVAPTAALLLVLHTSWWLVARRLHAVGWWTPNLLIVGATAYAEDLIRDALRRGHVNVLGVFDDRRERRPESVCGVPLLGGVEDLLAHQVTPFVDRIVIAVQPEPTQRALDLAARLSVLPNDITFFTADSEAPERALAVEALGSWPVGSEGAAGAAHRNVLEQRAMRKRLQDLLLAIPLLAVAAPLLLAIAAAIKLDSRGPVFFRQSRHGFNNEDIRVWKFRSMYHAPADIGLGGQVVADDPRVTRVGRLLRRTSLDELPQLFNVVRGEMSLVGPRPHAIGMKTGESEAAHLVAKYAHRHRVKPGMTGWAAIHGSRGPLHTAEEVRERVALDMEYINRHTLGLDLAIILRTLPTMLGDRSVTR